MVLIKEPFTRLTGQQMVGGSSHEGKDGGSQRFVREGIEWW